MIAKISNFRRIEYAEVEIDRLTLIAGRNENGKSSIAMAIGGLLSGNPSAHDVSRKDAEKIVRDGEKEGMVVIEDGESTASVVLPDGKVKTTGKTPPSISRIAAGLESVLDMKDKDRQNFLADFLSANPTREQFEAAVKDAELSDKAKDEIWKTISAYGWDAAHKGRVEIGAELKGRWKEVTGGETYGKNKADGWLPASWEPDMMNITKEKLAEELKGAQEWRDAALKGSALSDAERERLEGAVAELDGLDEKIQDAERALASSKESIQVIEKKVQDLTAVVNTQTAPCPHCKKPVKLALGGKLEKPSEKEEDNAKAKEELTDQTKALKAYRDQESDIQAEIRSLRNRKTVAQDASEKLKDEGSGKGGKKSDDLEDTEKRLERAKGRMDAFVAKTKAADYHDKIMRNDIVVKALAPNGLRQDVLQGALNAANKELHRLCAEAKWGTVAIEADMSVTYDRRPNWLLCESERYRTRAVLQLFMAMSEGAKLVIIDGADILDTPHRSALSVLLLKNGVPALMCATMDGPEKVKADKFDPAKGLRAYWVEAGKVRPLHKEA